MSGLLSPGLQVSCSLYTEVCQGLDNVKNHLAAAAARRTAGLLLVITVRMSTNHSTDQSPPSSVKGIIP